MAFIQINSGERTGEKIEIKTDEISIGRSSENTLTLEDPSVSGRHCIILRKGQRYSVRDLGSTNGTAVNGAPVRESRLAPGDVLSVGAVEINFDGDDVIVDDPSAGQTGSKLRAPTVRTAPIGDASPFGTRRDGSRRVWSAVITVVIILAAAAAGYFVAVLLHLL